MKRALPYAVAALAVALVVILGLRSCNLGEKVGRLEGALAEAKRTYALDKAAAEALIADQLRLIAAKDEEIAGATKTIGELTKAIVAKNATLGRLDADLAAAKTDAERVPILTSMVETWRAKYADLEGVVIEKDKQLDAWAVKYARQVDISSTYKAQLDKAERLLALSEDLNSALVAKARRLSLASNIKTVAIVGAVVGGGYLLLRGK